MPAFIIPLISERLRICTS